MKYVYGPVPSRRLGQSLGIDLIPLKTCNWNCVYCQLGRTVPLVNERADYFPPQEILAQAEEAFDIHEPGEIDWVTFVGSGEPTLHASISYLIRQVKALTDLPVAVITNGALLYLPEVRTALSAADAVMPSLDAGTPDLYRKINRPHPDITFERLVEGLVSFRGDYHGRLWPEVMLVRGLNDTDQALLDIASVLGHFQPDQVHISLPTRPPVETWVRPPDEEALMRAQSLFGDVARVVSPTEGSFDISGDEDVVDAIIGIITRHPMSEEELTRTLTQWASGEVNQALTDLEASGKAQVVVRYGMRFWTAAPGHYPDKTSSQRTSPRRGRHE